MAKACQCIRCGNVRFLRARKLCDRCHRWVVHNGATDQYPLRRRTFEEFASDYRVLRERGLTHREIAEAMGYRHRTVSRNVTRARGLGLLPPYEDFSAALVAAGAR